MPNQDDIASQQALLQAHRQTLHVLLEQQAKLGAAYAPPAIANGIADARAAIGSIKRALQAWGVAVDDMPDDEAPPDSVVPAARTPWPAGAQAGQDLIVTTIGDNAQGVAAGKNVRLTIGALATEADDQRAIADLLAQLDQALAANAAQIDAGASAMAKGYLRLLAGELSKSGGRAVPSASTIVLVGDWLLDTLPPLRAPLAALFAAPAARRALARSDTPLDAWLDQRFGQ